VEFLGIQIGANNRIEIANKILEFALTPLENSLRGRAGKAKFITYLNAHCVNTCFSDFEYREILQKADLVYAGGQGVVWAARFLGSPLPERANILDFFDLLVKELKNRITIYLLGGRNEIIKKAEEVLKNKGLKIVGSRDGFFGSTEEKEIIREVNILRPDILMVGMGVPKQEKWIYNHLSELDVKLCWAVGGVFDLFAGRLKQAPKWISACGLEWLYLGFQNPRRLLKRYLFGNFLFIYRILRCKLKKI
jgi:N-acetylglucosaminyldiphosphoundecaprenol N-acetyl-beta-D-mannosaminyltransferase